MVFAELQQNGIVDDAAVLVGDQHVLALSDLAFRQVPAAEILGKPRRVRAGDLDLALDGDVAQDGLVHQVPEVLHPVAEVARDIHVVVYRELDRPPAQGRIRIGRLPDLCSKTEPID